MNRQTFTMENLYEKIGLTDQMQAVLPLIPREEYLYYQELYRTNSDAFFIEAEQKEHTRAFMLSFFLHMAYDDKKEYEKRGIPDEIYFETFRDIPIWAENCRRDYGEYGLQEYHWIKNHIDLKLFRIGRLQYQPFLGTEEKELNRRSIAEHETVLNLHIPQGKPLLYESCVESLRLAGEFFKGQTIKEITCHSWLLSPALSKLLSPESNIMRFQSLFECYDTEEASREAEERVFTKLQSNPADYPEDTKLQRALKQFLLDGQKPGSGFGKIREGLFF